MIPKRPSAIVVAVVAALSSPAFAQGGAADAADPAAAAAGDENAVSAPAIDGAEGAKSADEDTVDVVARSRTPIQALNEHFVGSAARAVRFDWRRSPIIVGASISEVVEKNTFGQWRVGAFGKKAFDDLIVEVGVALYQSYDTPSSQSLALTPFRQAGRPNHLEIDANVGYAVAEGVVTPLASFIPPAEVVLVAVGGARYLGYAQSFVDRDIQAIALDLASPQLSTAELDRIEQDALGSMLVDPARLHAMAGLSLDVYLQPGLMLSPRAMVAIPVLVPVTNSSLGLFWELSFAAGWAF
jgi:hypothetical protein